MKRAIGWLALSAGLGCVAAGCGNDEGGEGELTGAEVPEVGQTAEALVTAEEGGEMRLADFALRVPAGAVRSDLNLTMEVAAAEDVPEPTRLRGPVYEMGPDGTRFDRPVTLELPIERLPRNNERAEVVWLDQGRDRWVPLDGLEVAEGKVRGRIDHFTSFSVRFVTTESGGGGVQQGLMCESSFTPCGGDLTGTWTFEEACARGDVFGIGTGDTSQPTATDTDGSGTDRTTADEPPAGGTDALSATFKQNDPCEGTSAEITVDITGSITFESGSTRGSQTIAFSSMSRVPSSCFEPSTCEQAGAVEEGEDCVFSYEDPGTAADLSGSYTTSGSVVTLLTETETLPEDMEYCVNGNTVTFVSVDEETGSEFRFTATR